MMVYSHRSLCVLAVWLCFLAYIPSTCVSFRFFPKILAYRRSLEHQVSIMDRQVRKSQEEASQLRQLLKVSHDKTRKASLEDRKQLVAREISLKQELSQLQKYIQELETLRDELEALLKAEQENVASLEQSLAELKEESSNEKIRLTEELQALLEKESNEKMDKLRKLMDQRIHETIEITTRKLEIQRERDIQSAVEEEQAKAQLQLIKERQRLEKDVEKERIKMRKLVKALAIKEKKQLSQANQQQTTANKISSSSSSSSQRPTIGIVSPIKK